MTIPHADLIRAVLDGKTVQVAHPDCMPPVWEEWKGKDAIQFILVNSAYRYRLKPEPLCVWTAINSKTKSVVSSVGVMMRGECPDWTTLRHEFDPDTGEYLRTVKEDGHG